MAADGNFHILDTEYKRTWQHLELDEHNRRDHIPGDTHNSHHSIDSAPVEAGTEIIKQRIQIIFCRTEKEAEL